jgi:hypothetical protein
MRVSLAVLLLAIPAAASTVNFSVTAIDGPFPSVIPSLLEIDDQEYVTITVEPDPAVETAVNQLVDAVIDYAVSYNLVQVINCPTISPVVCGGTDDYQVSGPFNLDSGATFGYGGLNIETPEDFQPVGSPNGILYLGAGTYTFQAFAQTVVEGIDATTNGAFASITGNFTVVDGNVLLGAPEPGLWPLCLLLLAGLLKFSGYRKA